MAREKANGGVRPELRGAAAPFLSLICRDPRGQRQAAETGAQGPKHRDRHGLTAGQQRVGGTDRWVGEWEPAKRRATGSPQGTPRGGGMGQA